METLFLACFAFGLLFTLASVVLGAAGGFHIGHIGHAAAAHGGHVGHAATGHVHTGDTAGHGSADAARATQLPLLNASSLVGALTWFGAAGYVLLRLADWSPVGVVVGALAAAAVGWYLIARFLQLVLKGEVEMNPDDDRLQGTVGQVTVPIADGKTGEVVFTKSGLTRSEAARAANGVAIPRGTEVVITGYSNGFATVQPWSEFLAEHDRLKVAQPREP